MTTAPARTSKPTATKRPGDGKRKARQVIDQHSVRLRLPENMGTITLPEPERLVFYGGVAALAALGIMDWPVAIVLGVGHMLADDHHHKCLCDLGEALEEA